MCHKENKSKATFLSFNQPSKFPFFKIRVTESNADLDFWA